MGVTAAMATQAQAISGYTQDEDNQLQGLLTKMQTVGSLDQADLQALSDLAQKKQEYNTALATVQQQQKYQTLNPAQTLVNTQTGKSQTAQ